jgi:uncharacterized membrane protein YuzA (DUF378 family)
MKRLDIIAAALVVVGGLNWGLGLEFGETNFASRVVYGLVGIAAVYQVLQQQGIRRRWSRDPQVTTA